MLIPKQMLFLTFFKQILGVSLAIFEQKLHF